MTRSQRHQVIVIGAGLAGLVAARRLADRGLDVVVLEARDRVGGRLWSRQLGNGEVVEMGGEWISLSQEPVVDLATELGLRLVATGMDFSSRDPVGGPPIPKVEHERLGEMLTERMRALTPKTLEEMTVEELLAGINESGPAMAVLRSRLEGTAGAGLDLMSAAEIGEEFGVDGHGSFARVEGGNDLLARQLARDLDLRFQKIVTSIHSSSTGVEVVVRNHVFPADAVVLAVPLGVLKRLVFEPDLSPEVSGALDALQMGVAVKTAVATEGEPGLFRRQDTDVPAWYWTGLRRDGSVRSAITGFAGSKPGVQALLGNVGERLARAAPDDRLDGEPVVVDWGSDVFAGGCYSVIGPGQRRLLEVLARPWGRRVFLAGEHVNGSGTIEGAILSGEDAVSRLLASGVC